MSRTFLTFRAGLLAVLFVAPACRSAAKEATARPNERTLTQDEATDTKKPAEPPVAKRAPDPVGASHYVFIGKPTGYQPLDCAIFETPEAPHRRPRRQLNDATDHPERLGVSIDFLEVVQNPARVSPSDPEILDRFEERVPAERVAFALGTRAFRSADLKVGHGAFDRAYCLRLNRLLGSNFVVLHAYPVYVDRGNSAPDFWRESWGSLGTDPGKANTGFDTLGEAKAFAATLLRKTR